MHSTISYLLPLSLILVTILSYYETTTSPNENQKTKLLETLQCNLLRYIIPFLLIIKIFNIITTIIENL